KEATSTGPSAEPSHPSSTRNPPDVPGAAKATPDRSTTETATPRTARKYATDAPTTPAPQTTTCRGGVTASGCSELPLLIPRRVGAYSLARDRHVEQVRAVLLRHALQPAAQRRLQLLGLGDGLTLHSLRARQPDVVDHGRAEGETGILAVAHHLAVGHLVGPVVAHDLVALVVRDDDEHRRLVSRHRPEAHRAVAERAVAQVQHDRPLTADRDLGPDGRAHAEAERTAAAARPRHPTVAERQQRRARRRGLLHHDRLAGQHVRQV